MKKRLISVLLCLAVAMGCMPLAAFAAGQEAYSVSTVEELIAAVLAINANGGDAAITLEGDITLSRDKWSAAGGSTDSGLTFQNGNVTIYGNGHTITADCSGNGGIDIRGTASVSLGAADYEQSLTLQGGGGNVNLTIPLLRLAENAALFLYDGVTVKDSLSLGTPAGIQLSGSSTCTMYGGQITNCNNGASVAGGVMVDNNASFFLCGGVISDCSGVSGGAVQISRQGRMLFSGGVIERCAGNTGGGVSLQYAAPIGDGSGAVVPGFTMIGGIIRSCSATQYGGGVCLYATEAAAEITGGSITDCEAGVYGGGAACLWGTLVVDNAAVCNNTAGQAADDIINYSGTITLGGIPAEQTLSSTGKTIEGWFDDGGDGGRWRYDETDPAQNYLQKKPPVTDFAEQLCVKAAHGLSYTVTYVLNGGSGTGYDPERVAEGETVRLKAAPSRSGYTFLAWTDGTADYQPGDCVTVERDLTFLAKWKKNSTSSATYYTLTYETDGGTSYTAEIHRKGDVVKLDKRPVREDHIFAGWYADRACTQKLESIRMTGDKTVYAGWTQMWTPPALNGDAHVAYIIGYDDGLVHPEANMTRAEVATIFFRLLREEVRLAHRTTENSFADVSKERWYNTAVSTLADMGIVNGYPEGGFGPGDPITRGEFAAICARFDEREAFDAPVFTDIAQHWAEAEIEKAAGNGWVTGYPDGTFQPDRWITRSEGMAMINRVLNRNPEAPEDLLPDMITWPDNQDVGKWYYIEVQEATNSHAYERNDRAAERWTAIEKAPDWAALES